MTKRRFLRGACPELIEGLRMTRLNFLMDYGLRTTDTDLARMFHELMSRDHEGGRATGQPQVSVPRGT
jgi:hypothetical protein